MELKVQTRPSGTGGDEEKVVKTLNRIRHKIIVMSGKGGVGKSTLATNLAIALSARGWETGLLDVDIHGPNVPKMLRIEDATITGDGEGIVPVKVPPHLRVMSMAFLLSGHDRPVIWRGPLKMGAIRQFLGQVKWGPLDYLVVDLPPGTGDEPLSIAQLIPDADGVVIVTTPQEVALLDSRKSVNFARELGLPVIGIVENMSGYTCPHCGKTVDIFKSGGGERAARDMRVPFLGKIPFDPVVVDSGDSGAPVVLSSPESPPARALQLVVDGIVKRTKKANGEGAK
ncbi:MAG: Mrp/NBP35 family ATP-binding protein [Euryarchaeota archaeon]|nr:Mrp/NBP35 family ATP-binding protein [Euryarchaeota archaeon]